MIFKVPSNPYHSVILCMKPLCVRCLLCSAVIFSSYFYSLKGLKCSAYLKYAPRCELLYVYLRQICFPLNFSDNSLTTKLDLIFL